MPCRYGHCWLHRPHCGRPSCAAPSCSAPSCDYVCDDDCGCDEFCPQPFDGRRLRWAARCCRGAACELAVVPHRVVCKIDRDLCLLGCKLKAACDAFRCAECDRGCCEDDCCVDEGCDDACDDCGCRGLFGKAFCRHRYGGCEPSCEAPCCTSPSYGPACEAPAEHPVTVAPVESPAATPLAPTAPSHEYLGPSNDEDFDAPPVPPGETRVRPIEAPLHVWAAEDSRWSVGG
jgi:hypothetical protein